MGTSSIHNNTIDVLRFLSISAVILIHTTTRHLEVVHFYLPSHQFTLFLNQLSRFAVPLFFLISGYVLELNYRPGYFNYLRKRFSRIVLPYLFWSVLYYFLIYTKHSVGFLSALLTGDSSYQLYFIPSLLLFYLLFPLLRKLRALPIVLFMFFVQLFILYLSYRLQFPSVPYPLAVAIFNLFPFLFGIFMSRIPSNRFTALSGLLIVPVLISIYQIYFEGFSGYQHTYNIHYFYSQWRPSVLIYAITLFLLLYSYLPKHISHISSLISQLSKLSFFVFFIHILVLEFVWKSLGIYIYQYPLFDLFYFSIVFSVSFSLAYVFHHIFRLNQLTG